MLSIFQWRQSPASSLLPLWCGPQAQVRDAGNRPTDQPLVTQWGKKGKTVSRKFELFLELIIAAGFFSPREEMSRDVNGTGTGCLTRIRLSVDINKKRVDDRCGRRCQQGYKHQLYIYTFSQQVSLLEGEVGRI